MDDGVGGSSGLQLDTKAERGESSSSVASVALERMEDGACFFQPRVDTRAPVQWLHGGFLGHACGYTYPILSL